MPTGYTAGVVDGKIDSFAEFAMQCARAFGALVTMRDEPFDAEIPNEFKPNPYCQERLDKSRENVHRLVLMSIDEIARESQADYESRLASRENSMKIQQLQNERIEKMLSFVKAWEPPSADHIEMKKFMIQQLEVSKHDLSFFDRCDKIEKETPAEWHKRKLKEAQKDIDYYTEKLKEEKQRCAERTLWVKQLRESLK